MTNKESSGILARLEGDVVCMKVVGKGTHLNSHLLKQFFQQVFDQNIHRIQIDVGECSYMDSTFLGTLTGIALRTREKNLPPIQLLNLHQRIKDMLTSLGVDSFFESGGFTEKPGSNLQPVSGESPDIEEKTEEMISAHQALIQANANNVAKFQDVITLMQKKLMGDS
ncbi:MAG: STAS domain-containing protein [Verrucomicrobiae bacterium]|nr:STAS domain-containing protein [Verrucomicrobiae bacterium]